MSDAVKDQGDGHHQGQVGDARAAWIHREGGLDGPPKGTGLKEGFQTVGNPTGTGDPRVAWAREPVVRHQETGASQLDSETIAKEPRAHTQAAVGDPRAAWMHRPGGTDEAAGDAAPGRSVQEGVQAFKNPTATGDPRRGWVSQ